MADAAADDMGTALMQQLMDIYVRPELERRSANGRPAEQPIRAAQVVMSVQKGNVVRLNDEVRAVIRGRATRAIGKGEIVNFEQDCSELVEARLPDDEADCGHLTAIGHRGLFFIFFDFRYNRAICRRHLEVAREFFASSSANLDAGRMAPFVEDLWSCVELTAKALIMPEPDPKILEAKTHPFVRGKLDRKGRHDATAHAGSKLLRKLNAVRQRARYPMAPFELPSEDAKALLAAAEEFMSKTMDALGA